MMFKFFRQNSSSRLRASTSIASAEYKGDSLNRSMTDVAIQLINGEGGSEFRGYFIDLFRHDPRFLKDVAPEHRDALIAVLDRHQKEMTSRPGD